MYFIFKTPVKVKCGFSSIKTVKNIKNPGGYIILFDFILTYFDYFILYFNHYVYTSMYKIRNRITLLLVYVMGFCKCINQYLKKSIL